MTGERPDRALGAVLDGWMNEVAPTAVPVVVLEEAFARTMTSRQVRVHPWDRVLRWSQRPRRLTRLALVASAALLLAALGFGVLGGGSGVGPGPSTTPSPSPAANVSPAVSVPPPSPSPFPATPIVPTASVAVTAPQSLVTDGKVVWLLTGTGSVAPIDTARNSLGTRIQTGATTDFYQGISVDANGVWVTEWNTATLYRVDPTAGKVIAKIPAGLAPKGVLATGSAVWVADTHGGAVLRIDPATNKVTATIRVGPAGTSGPNWLAAGLGSIWVGIPNASTVVRIDPNTDAIQATIDVPGDASPCGGFAITTTAVWIAGCDETQTMARVDPATNRAVGVAHLDGHAHAPTVIHDAPWVSIDTAPHVPGYLARVSSEQNAVDRGLTPATDFGGGGDMVVIGQSVWVIDGGHDRILRLPLSGFAPN